jgi:hypothetical protein
VDTMDDVDDVATLDDDDDDDVANLDDVVSGR